MTNIRLPDYEVAGAGRITVFLLHGAYGSKTYYKDVIKSLVNQGYRVVAWDAPGYGLSPLPENYSIPLLADACTALIRHVGGEVNILLGHSMGGIVAPLVAKNLGKELDGLIISATVGSFSNKTKAEQELFLKERVEPLSKGESLSDAAVPVIRSMFAPTSSGEGVENVIAEARLTHGKTFVAAIKAIVEYDGSDAINSIAIPTLVIAGEYDSVGQPAAMKALAEQIESAEFVEVKDAGHYAWAEQPEKFNTALFDFINRAAATA